MSLGVTLNLAATMGACTLTTDRAMWEGFANKAGLKVLVEGSVALFNQYGIGLMNTKVCANVRQVDGQVFIDWMLSREGTRHHRVSH